MFSGLGFYHVICHSISCFRVGFPSGWTAAHNSHPRADGTELGGCHWLWSACCGGSRPDSHCCKIWPRAPGNRVCHICILGTSDWCSKSKQSFTWQWKVISLCQQNWFPCLNRYKAFLLRLSGTLDSMQTLYLEASLPIGYYKSIHAVAWQIVGKANNLSPFSRLWLLLFVWQNPTQYSLVRYVGLWRASVLAVQVEMPERRTYGNRQSYTPVRGTPKLSLMVGDSSGARSQLLLPYNRRWAACSMSDCLLKWTQTNPISALHATWSLYYYPFHLPWSHIWHIVCPPARASYSLQCLVLIGL